MFILLVELDLYTFKYNRIMVLLMFCLFYYFFSFYVSGMKKEDCQLGPMSCQKKENRMPLGGLTALCLYAKTLHNTLNHVTQKVWMDTFTPHFLGIS